MGACRMPPLLTLAAVALLLTAAAATAELPVMTIGDHEHALARRLTDDDRPNAERHRGVVTGAGASGFADDSKAYIVGRPLFKVPPSSPCRRVKSARC